MSYLKNVRAYLGGPIEFGDANSNWREEPTKVLRTEFGINLFDPFADPKQQWSDELTEARRKCDYETMATIAKRFVQKDLTIVSRVDMVVSYLPHGVPTTGTHHEIINSNNDKKPTLLVCPQGKQYVPLWYYGFIPHEQMFGSWGEMFSYLRDVNAGQHRHNRRWHYIYGMI